jgi:hypothetical protein
MGVAILVVEHSAALDGFLGNLEGDMDAAIRARGGGFHCQFESV